MQIKRSEAVEDRFENYPIDVRKKMEKLRQLVINTAEEMEDIDFLEETLKWGEPSYIAKKGTTLRMDWKSKNPDQYAIYFQCTSMMIPTIKKVYGDLFQYEGSRALIFKMNESLPTKELEECIKMALQYHRLKHLPFLGY